MYLVTGAAGFCGFEFLKYLQKKGEKVRATDIVPLPGKLDNVDFVIADIRQKEPIYKACQGVTRIIHTAAKVPISKAGKGFYEVNVEGTRNVLEAALTSGVQKVVHLSSSAVQFLDSNPIDEYAPYNPLGPYARSKMEGELVCKEYVEKGLNVDVIRPRTILGKGRLGLFQIFFEWITDGKNIYVVGKGNNRIQFLHIDDLADCCYRASLHNDSNIYNIGGREYATLRQDLQYLLDYAHTGSRIISLPVGPTIFLLRFLDFVRLSPLAPWHYLSYHKDFYFTNQHAQERLDWAPHYGNKEILKIAYDSYRTSGKAQSHTYGVTHRKALKQGILRLLKKVS
jgi:nucleoside-diphosphate-sugar epimerase